MVISMEEEKVKASCMAIQAVCAELETCMNNVEQIMQSANQGWQGEAERAYERKIAGLRYQYAKIIAFFQAYGKELEAITDAYEEWETDNASRIQNI